MASSLLFLSSRSFVFSARTSSCLHQSHIHVPGPFISKLKAKAYHDAKNHPRELLSTPSTHTQQATATNTQQTQEQKNSQPRRTKLRSIFELMRWHKPIGTILALTPSLWAVGLATPSTVIVPDLKIMAIFTAGAIVARGMGCTLNDLLDRKYDRLVERTKNRPIANGDISAKEGLCYLTVQSVLGLYILCLNNLTVIKLGLFSGLMIASYPLFKRFTYWPQLMLAFTMNWGVLMGFAAVRGTLFMNDLTSLLPVYLGSIFWTLYYDTIYAHQDKTDDMFIGIKSTALRLGSKTRPFLYATTGGMFSSLATAGLMTDQVWPFYLCLAISSVIHANQVKNLNFNDTHSCWNVFDSQKYIGFLILAGVLGSVALKYKKEKKPLDQLKLQC